MKKGYLPYKIPLEDYFETSLKVNGFVIPEQDDNYILKEWSPEGLLQICFTVEIHNMFKLDDYLQKKASAVIITSWYSDVNLDGNLLRGKINSQNVTENAIKYELTGVIDNTLLSGAVTVAASFVLFEPGIVTDPIKADRKGLMLWSKEYKIILEGAVSYFPTADVSFKDNSLPSAALFHLQKNYDEVTIPFSSKYQLLVNNQHPLFNIINDAGVDVKDRWIRSFFEYSVYKNVIEDALNSEDFAEYLRDDQLNNCIIGSTAEVYKYLLEQVFEKKCDIEEFKNLYKHTKSKFESMIQNKFLRSDQ